MRDQMAGDTELLKQWSVEVPLHRLCAHTSLSTSASTQVPTRGRKGWRDILGVKSQQSGIEPSSGESSQVNPQPAEQSSHRIGPTIDKSSQAEEPAPGSHRAIGRPVDMEVRRDALRARLALARGLREQLALGGDREAVAAAAGFREERFVQILRLLRLSPQVVSFVETTSGPVPPERVLRRLATLSEAEQEKLIQEWVGLSSHQEG